MFFLIRLVRIKNESIRHLLIALFLGLITAYIKENFDRVFHSADQVDKEFEKLELSNWVYSFYKKY